MNEQIQAIVTVLSLINPAICAAMFATAAAGRSLGEKAIDATKDCPETDVYQDVARRALRVDG